MLYYLDESREPRECPGCKDCTTAAVGPTLSTAFREHDARSRCNGTGRLGVEGAEPELEVFYGVKLMHAKGRPIIATDHYAFEENTNKGYPMGWWAGWSGWAAERGWPGMIVTEGPYPTEAEALAAAREAAGKDL